MRRAGIVTLEDVLEEIVNMEIHDENDRINDNSNRTLLQPLGGGDGYQPSGVRLGHVKHVAYTYVTAHVAPHHRITRHVPHVIYTSHHHTSTYTRHQHVPTDAMRIAYYALYLDVSHCTVHVAHCTFQTAHCTLNIV
jgi:hypothetical protein